MPVFQLEHENFLYWTLTLNYGPATFLNHAICKAWSSAGHAPNNDTYVRNGQSEQGMMKITWGGFYLSSKFTTN